MMGQPNERSFLVMLTDGDQNTKCGTFLCPMLPVGHYFDCCNSSSANEGKEPSTSLSKRSDEMGNGLY